MPFRRSSELLVSDRFEEISKRCSTLPGSGSGESRMLSQQELRSGMITGCDNRPRFCPAGMPFFYLSRPQVRMIPVLNNSLFLDCLNTKLFKSLETVLHGFEFFGGVPPANSRLRL